MIHISTHQESTNKGGQIVEQAPPTYQVTYFNEPSYRQATAHANDTDMIDGTDFLSGQNAETIEDARRVASEVEAAGGTEIVIIHRTNMRRDNGVWTWDDEEVE